MRCTFIKKISWDSFIFIQLFSNIACSAHTECHLSATQQSYSTLITAVTKILQQTKDKKTKNLPETDTLLSDNSHLSFLCFFFFWTGRRMGESGKRCCTVWQETKTESRDDRVKTDTLIVTRAQFYSVWENFISCLFRKISRQEKKFTHKCPLGLPSKKILFKSFSPIFDFLYCRVGMH